MKWRPIHLWQVTVAESRGAITWWRCPRLNRPVLRSRAGSIYDLRFDKCWAIRKRPADPFTEN